MSEAVFCSSCLQGKVGRGWLLIFSDEERPHPNPPLQAGEGAELASEDALRSSPC